MGLIKAFMGAAGGVLADMWLDFFTCEAMPVDTLVLKGQRYTGGRGSNTKGSDNIISNGSGIVVAEGQAMAIINNGVVVEYADQPGGYTFDEGGEPSLFTDSKFLKNLEGVFMAGIDRFRHGGGVTKDHRVYYFNIKEITGNKYGTSSPVPFRVVDTNIGLDVDISIRCNGEYSYRITNPILFYTNVTGNVEREYKREQIDSQLKTELMTAMQPAFARISSMGIRYSALPGHTQEISDALNEVLSAKWRDLRGIEVVSFGVNSVAASPEDEKMIKELQKSAVMRDPNMAAATLVGAQADAMRAAASNEGGAMVGFMGLGMANQAGGANPAQLFAMSGQGQPQQSQYQSAPDGGFPAQGQPQGAPQQGAPQDPASWTCTKCGKAGNTGKFCSECAAPAPETGSWICTNCGKTGNTGKFCSECAAPKP